jgi:hypothetical protein
VRSYFCDALVSSDANVRVLGRRSEGRAIDAARRKCDRPVDFVRVIGNVAKQRRAPDERADKRDRQFARLILRTASPVNRRNVAEAIVRIRGAVMTKALAGGLLPFRALRVRRRRRRDTRGKSEAGPGLDRLPAGRRRC